MNLCVSNSLSSLHIYISLSKRKAFAKRERERERETSRVARVTNKRYGGLFAFQHHHHHHRDHHFRDISKAQKTLAQKRRGFGRDCGGFGSRPKSSSSSSFSGGAAWQKPPPPQSKIGVVPGGGGLGGGDDDDDERQRMDRHRVQRSHATTTPMRF